MKKGKEYELLIERLYRQLEPNADIVQDDYIFGRDSETKRQIDISIRYRFLGIDHLVIVQAKDYTRPAGVKAVDELQGVVKDVNANKGILICAKGFSKHAKDYAKNVGIELLTVHEASKKNWETEVKIKVRKTVHTFDSNASGWIKIADLAGKQARMDLDFFSYDKVNIIGLTDIISDHILKKHSWKDIRKGRKITLDFKNLSLYSMINEEFRPVESGYIEIQYTNSKTQVFLETPANYIYQVDHLSNTKTLHNLTISIESLNEIISPDYQPEEIFDLSTGFDINILTYNFKDAGFTSNFEFAVPGGIIGPSAIKDRKIMLLDDRAERIIKLENTLRQRPK